MSDGTVVLDVTLAAGPDAPRKARALIESASPTLPRRITDDLLLLVNELVTNSIRHGGLDAGAEIRLQLFLLEGGVRGVVCDSGRGMALRPAREPGFGLHLVQRVAARWGITRDEETCVWFELDVEGNGGASHAEDERTNGEAANGH